MFREIDYVINFIKDFVTDNNLIELYTNLVTSYGQAGSSSTPEIEKQIETTREKLREAHTSLDLELWTDTKRQIFKRLGAGDVIGTGAYQRLIKALEDNYANMNGAIQAIEELKTETTQVVTKVDALVENLSLTALPGVTEEGEEFFEISFENKASIESFDNMKDQAEDWNFILRSFAELTGARTTDVKLVYVTKGSPLIAGVVTKLITAKAIIDAAERVSKIKDGLLKLLKLQRDSKDSVMPRDKAKVVNTTIEASIGEIFSLSIKKESTEIESTYRNNKSSNRYEMQKKILESMKRMYKFTDNGGRIVHTEEIEGFKDPELPKKLLKRYKEIQKLQEGLNPPLLEAYTKKLKEELKKGIEADKEPVKQQRKPKKKRGRPRKESPKKIKAKK